MEQEFEKISETKNYLMNKILPKIKTIMFITRMLVDPFVMAYLLKLEQEKFNSLYLKNRKILGKTFYVKNSKGKVLKSYKVLETMYLEAKSTMVIKYRERIFLKNGVRERVTKRWQDIKILEHKLGRAL